MAVTNASFLIFKQLTLINLFTLIFSIVCGEMSVRPKNYEAQHRIFI